MFPDILFKRDLTRDLEFSISWNEPKTVSIIDVINQTTFDGDRLTFEAVIGANEKGDERPVCKSFAYSLGLGGSGLPSLMARMGPHEKRRGKYELECDGFKLVRQPGRPWELPAPLQYYGFPAEVTVYFQNAEVLRELPFTFQKQLKRLFYLGPLRDHPKRQYSWAGDTPEQVGFRGENWASALLAAKKRKLSPGKKATRASPAQPFEQIIARWLESLGLIHSFKVEPVAKGTREYRVQVRLSEHSEAVSIPDVGFGVSQILPILVECFYAPPNSTIVIEQPELHLHPAVQQGLADLFIEVIRSREDGEDRNIQLIIESHSEHFLRRLQRRIAEQVISRDEVAAYFCAPGKDALELGELKVDLFGNIINWPKDFFGDQMTDIAEMTKAAHSRRRTEAGAKATQS
jgi:hypothetical protein